jgi:DNA-binding winged helix-turn-helix (wHTH) protein
MIYQFSYFDINSLNKQFCINGHLIVADERITSLLIELIIKYPNHCSKSSLLTTLWPDTVVSNWSISKLVSEARNVFKQHGYKGEVIHTLHGRGYRLNSALGEEIVKTDHYVPTAKHSTQKQQGRHFLN